MKVSTRIALVSGVIALMVACSSSTSSAPTAADAAAFLTSANDAILRVGTAAQQAG